MQQRRRWRWRWRRNWQLYAWWRRRWRWRWRGKGYYRHFATTRATTVVMTTKVTVGWRWRRRWRWRWRLKGYYRHFCRHRRRHQAYSCQLRRHRHRHRRRCCICHCRSTYNAYNLVNVVIAIAIAYHNYRILYHCFYNRRRHAIALVFFWERLSRKSPNQSPSPSLLQIRSYVTDAFPLV